MIVQVGLQQKLLLNLLHHAQILPRVLAEVILIRLSLLLHFERAIFKLVTRIAGIALRASFLCAICLEGHVFQLFLKDGVLVLRLFQSLFFDVFQLLLLVTERLHLGVLTLECMSLNSSGRQTSVLKKWLLD